MGDIGNVSTSNGTVAYLHSAGDVLDSVANGTEKLSSTVMLAADTRPDSCGDRWARLQRYGTTALYHQTSPASGKSIMATGFDIGHAGRGIAGRGMYFATSLSATFKKAQHFGFCIEARVYLGHPKDEPRHPPSGLSLRSLNSECYDSVHIDRGWKGGDEYVVYANDQMPQALLRHVDCRA